MLANAASSQVGQFLADPPHLSRVSYGDYIREYSANPGLNDTTWVKRYIGMY